MCFRHKNIKVSVQTIRKCLIIYSLLSSVVCIFDTSKHLQHALLMNHSPCSAKSLRVRHIESFLYSTIFLTLWLFLIDKLDTMLNLGITEILTYLLISWSKLNGGRYACKDNGDVVCNAGWIDPKTLCVTPECFDTGKDILLRYLKHNYMLVLNWYFHVRFQDFYFT